MKCLYIYGLVMYTAYSLLIYLCLSEFNLYVRHLLLHYSSAINFWLTKLSPCVTTLFAILSGVTRNMVKRDPVHFNYSLCVLIISQIADWSCAFFHQRTQQMLLLNLVSSDCSHCKVITLLEFKVIISAVAWGICRRNSIHKLPGAWVS